MELTLIVASTRTMGIGLKGKLPWTGLKKEMAYFARVTKRGPSTSPTMNAVIMGRKTWESIPPKFRPLKGRLNIVISRSFPHHPTTEASGLDITKEPVKASSLHQAIQYLKSSPPETVGKVFVIGGGQIYNAALGLPETRRVLLTSIMTEFECDTAFPIKLVSGTAESDAQWTQKSNEELNRWVGEEVPNGMQEENGTSYEFQMWERAE